MGSAEAEGEGEGSPSSFSVSSLLAALHMPTTMETATADTHAASSSWMPSMPSSLGAALRPSAIRDLFGDARREARGVAERAAAATGESLRVASSAYTEHVEKVVTMQMRRIVRWALEEHPLEARAAAAAALVLAFPPTRRLLYRNTVGLIRSEEAVLKGHERQFESLTTRTKMLDGEKARLLERLAHAEAEFVRSKQKLDGALVNVRGLEREATAVFNRSAALMDSVRSLSRSKETLALQVRCDATRDRDENDPVLRMRMRECCA